VLHTIGNEKREIGMKWQRSILGLLAAGALSVGLAGPATSQIQPQDGLVNVAVGDIMIAENVDIEDAAQIVAEVCGLKVGPVAVLGRAVDLSGGSGKVCTVEDGDVVIEQN
jgi:hypothetical protein